MFCKKVFFISIICVFSAMEILHANHENNLDLQAGEEYWITSADGLSTHLSLEETNGGELGIGTADPASPLHIVTSGDDTSPILTLNNTGTDGGTIQFFHTTSTTGPENEISANVGDVVFNSGTGDMYIKKGTDGNDDDWAEFSNFKLRQTVNIASGASEAIVHDADTDETRDVEVYIQELVGGLGPNVAPSMTEHDPDDYSNLYPAANNNVLNDLWWNNNSFGDGPVGDWLGLDHGTQVTVDAFTLVDWNQATWIVNNFVFQTSNVGGTNPADWTTQLAVTGHTYSPDPGTTYFLPSPVTARYFRIQYQTGASTCCWVVSELQIYQDVGSTVLRKAIPETEVRIEKTSNTVTTITNNTGAAIDVDILIYGEF